MDHGKLIKHAWHVTWKNRVLWVFGFLLALLGGTGGGRGGTGFQYTIDSSDITRLQSLLSRWMRQWRWRPGALRPLSMLQFDHLVGLTIAGLILLGLVGLVIGVVCLLVRYTCSGALVSSVDDLEERRPIGFKRGFRQGWSRVLRLIGIDVLLALATVAAGLVILVVFALGALVVAGPLILVGQQGGELIVLAIIWAALTGVAALAVYTAVLIAFGGLVSTVHEYALRACMLNALGIRASIATAVKLIKTRFRESLITWLMLVGIGLAIGLIAIPIALVGLGSLALPPVAIWRATGSEAATMVVALPLAFVGIAIALLASGIYIAFRSTVWTLTYRELAQPATPPAEG